MTRRLAADPKSLTVRAALARLYLTTGRTDDAKKSYEELLSQSPPTSPPFSASRKSPSRKRSGRRQRTISPAPATAAPNDPAPGSCSLTCTGCSRIGNTRHRRQPSLSPSSRQMSRFSTHKAGYRSQPATRTARCRPTSARTNSHPASRPILSRYLVFAQRGKETSQRSGLCCRPRSIAILKMHL